MTIETLHTLKQPVTPLGKKPVMQITLQNDKIKEEIHHHDYFELSYVAFGKIQHQLDTGETVHLEKGNICIITPGVSHYCIIEDSDTIVLNFALSIDVFNRTFFLFMLNNDIIGSFFLNYILENPESRNKLLIRSEYNKYSDSLIERIIEENYSDNPYASINIKSLLVLFFSEQLSMSFSQTKRYSPRVEKIISYMVSEISTITLKETASHFNMHPNYLSAYIKKETNRTFADIISDIRIAKARYLLTNPALTLEKISSVLGYAETASFCNMFKKRMGQTPSQFRKGQSL